MEGLVLLMVVGATCAAPASVAPYTGSLVAAPAPAPAHVAAHAFPPVTYISRHHAQDELGQVNYGFAHPGQAKNEIRDAYGNVAGAYSYIDADNNPVHVEYTAGVDGFQVRSNNLPVGPDASHAPKPVRDTPEVTAAKVKFVEAYNTAAVAAALAPDDEVVVKTIGDLDDVMFEAEPEEDVVATTQLGVIAEDSSAVTTETPQETEEETPVMADAAEVKKVPEQADASQSTRPLDAAGTDEKDPVAAIEEEQTPQSDSVPSESQTTEELQHPDAAEVPTVTTLGPEIFRSDSTPEDPAEEVFTIHLRSMGHALESLQNIEPVPVLEELPSEPAYFPEATVDTTKVQTDKESFQATYNTAAAAAPDFGPNGLLSPYFGYLSAIDKPLSPLYTNTFPYGAYGIHAPYLIPLNVPTPSEISQIPVMPYYHYVHQNSLNYAFPYAPQFIKYVSA